MLPEITPRELDAKLKGPNPPLLIDVRDADEFAFNRIEGAQHKPLAQIAAWAKELDPEAEIVLHCHVGARSGQATLYLQRLGFKHVYNLKGGIDAWSLQIDPDIERY
jgi:rhodanese-related sulfurtransferase